ncbi:MerR family transcriptional regulator [Saccharomonospora iraqiensis]|uniref:MerR family transcriptional regulator n=1 Tax=Saccharomonospora iraqiensis TaxID=52698 RepID=UPI000556EFED|nr:MerR family transcriptional regulator [Saccharomonospora iraqiensis]
MAELSRESGVPVATVKYYLREGLLHPGERTGRNQARYDDGHVRRLRLVRALLDVGGLSIADVKGVLAAMAAEETSLHEVLGLAQRGLPLTGAEVDDASADWARTKAGELMAERGWDPGEDSPVVEALVGVLATVRSLGHPELASMVDRYADAAEEIAEADLDHVSRLASTESVVESAVVGTVFGDALLVVLRRLAQSGASSRRFEGRRDG